MIRSRQERPDFLGVSVETISTPEVALEGALESSTPNQFNEASLNAYNLSALFFVRVGVSEVGL